MHLISPFLAAVEIASTPAVAAAPAHPARVLAVILGFILGLILLIGHFKFRRMQLWHETARIALEKGQPLPEGFGQGFGLKMGGALGGRNFARWRAWRDVRGGIILLAISFGLFIAHPGLTNRWVTVMGCVGLACLLLGGIGLKRANETSPTAERDPVGKS